MAKPIQLDFPARNHQAELRQRLENAPAEHAAALLEFYELLEVLHRQKVLTTLRGAVAAGDDLVSHVAKAAAEPETVRALRNLIALSKILGQIDPEVFSAIERSIPPAFKNRDLRRQTPPPSIWKIIRTFWSPPVQRVLFAFGLTLAGIGYYMNKERPSTADEA